VTLVLFGIATFILTVSPGPGVLYVTARSLAQSRRAGFLSINLTNRQSTSQLDETPFQNASIS
jgi:hypothetical protein